MNEGGTAMASGQYSLSMILPLYNEIEILEANLQVIDDFLARHFEDYEILIVESGSTDGSAELCDRLAGRFERVKIIHEGARNGIGSATRVGFQRASKDLAWRYAIDLPCPLEAILEALPLFAKYKARIKPSVIKVLPLPEWGAAITMALANWIIPH